MANKNAKSLEDLEKVSEILYESSKYQLESEVFLWSLYYVKEHPEASIEEALNAGMVEWDL